VDFAVAMLHAEQPDRRQDQRQRRGFAENGGREIAPGNVDQDALAKFYLLQIVMVGAQRIFGIGAAIRIVEECLRHVALVQQAQIFDAGNVFHKFPGLPALYLRFDISSSMVGPAAKSPRGAAL